MTPAKVDSYHTYVAFYKHTPTPIAKQPHSAHSLLMQSGCVDQVLIKTNASVEKGAAVPPQLQQ
jgi:hypothetical protein